MGDALGSQFDVLWQEVSRLHIKRAEYVELFGSKPNRVDLLNRAASAFFIDDSRHPKRPAHLGLQTPIRYQILNHRFASVASSFSANC
jgi:hypothetical protein